MKNISLPHSLPVVLLLLVTAVAAAPKQKINPPPSAELIYAIKAQQKGLQVEGDSLMRWSTSGASYSAANEARAMLVGKILDTSSEGGIDAYGLAPSSFMEKRFRREKTITTFDRKSNAIRFSTSERGYPIKGGEQDRSSAVWQLISLIRAAPAKAKTGAQWSFPVAGRKDVDVWSFKAMGQSKIRTAAGELQTLHITRSAPADSKEQHLDIWLAPSLEWYPARLRYTDDNGDFIEQTLQRVNRKTP